MPVKIIKNPLHDKNKSLGWFTVEVIEHFMVHGSGDIIGEPARLVDETVEMIVDSYALHPVTGKRLYSSSFFSRSKGFAKSEAASFLAMFEAMFPCRFDHWVTDPEGETYSFMDFTYTFRQGEAYPKPIPSPFVRLIATEEDQITKGVYATIYFNLSDGNTKLSELFNNSDIGLKKIRIPWNNGEIVPSTSSGAAKDGGKESFVVFDETHLYDSTSLRQTYTIVTNNLKKRKAAEPWGLETSTMFEPGAESVAEKSFESALQIEEGKTQASEHTKLYFNWRYGPEDTDFEDYKEVLKGLHEAYGDFAQFMDLEAMASGFFDVRFSTSNQKRFFFNLITEEDDSWIESAAWKQCELDEADYLTDPLLPGDKITLGFDGSKGRKDDKDKKRIDSQDIADSTALVGVRLRDGLSFVLGLWEQPEGKKGLGWKPPIDEINERVAEAFKEYSVVGFYADPSGWETEVATWEQKYRKHLKTSKRISKPIAWTFSDGPKLAKAIDFTQEAIFSQEIKHFDQKDLGKHIRNARAVKKRYGTALYKPLNKSERKIDAAICLVLAYQARLDALSFVSTENKNTGRVYLRPPIKIK